MSYREIETPRRPNSRQAAVLAAALLLAGCSGSKLPAQQASTPDTSAQAAPSTQAAPATAPAGPPPSPTSSGQLDGGTCLQLTGAVVNLMSGSSPDDARKASDTISGFHPPADVQAAVAHFVSTNGLHTSDPDRTQYSRALNDWVEKQCPVQRPPEKPK